MPLHSRDVQKILSVGFFIIREDRERKAIKRKTLSQPEWHILKKDFPSVAAMRRAMDELLESSNVIED